MTTNLINRYSIPCPHTQTTPLTFATTHHKILCSHALSWTSHVSHVFRIQNLNNFMNYSLKNGLVHSQKCCQAYHRCFQWKIDFYSGLSWQKQIMGFSESGSPVNALMWVCTKSPLRLRKRTSTSPQDHYSPLMHNTSSLKLQRN